MTKGRNEIISRVKKNKPSPMGLPEVPLFDQNRDDLTEWFMASLVANHAQAEIVKNIDEALEKAKVIYPEAKNIASKVEGFNGNYFLNKNNKEELTRVDLAVLQGHMGIAENGAIWVCDEDTDIRALPFAAEYLLLLIDSKDIVPDMYSACLSIDFNTGYGVFISGPSKTADIEQSLVIGAHGPRGLTVMVIEE